MTFTEARPPFFTVRRSIALAIGIVLAHLLLMRFTQNNPALRANINDVFNFGLSLGIATGLFHISNRFRHIRHIQVAWTLLGAGLSLVTIGAIIYAILDAQGAGSFPSISDAFFLAFYPVFGSGLILMSWSSLTGRERIKTLIDFAIVMIAAFLVFWIILIAPTLAAEKNAEPLTVAIGIAYPICDWALIFAILRVLYSGPGAIYPQSLLFLAFAGMGQVVGDGLYITQTLAGTYVVGNLVDTLYTANMSLLFLMIGFQLAPSPKWAANRNPVNVAYPQFGWVVYLPNLWAAVAYIVLVWAHYRPLPISFEALVWAVGGILVLVIARQIVVSQENDRLGRQLQAELLERKSAEQSVRKLNEELERRVLERTSALTQEIAERKQVEAEREKLITQLSEEITERKHIEATLEQRVEERTSELEALSYNIGHDLRSPIRAINAYSSLLLDELAGQIEPERQRKLQQIHNVSLHMGQMVDDFLIFLRIGHASLKKQNVDVNDLVRQVLEKFAPEVSGRAIEFRIERLPDCMADAELLKTAYRQLIANAIKFTRSRNSARIELGAVNQSGQTCYFLRDNGIGFDLKHASKLFGVFQRLHPEGDEEGTGMGLAIARRIIERHGGRIWAEAEVDKGATFFFTMQ